MKALILVDIQNDFCPDGALAVPEGDQVVPLANRLQEHFDLVIATQDWHPSDHASFASQHPGKNVGEVVELNGQPQVLWPDHCVQSTQGAEFHPELHTKKIVHIFQKGQNREIDSYSGFFDNDQQTATGLGEYLWEKGVEQVFICGLATDYCVKFTALDARRLSFDTFVIADACRGVNLQPGDADKALREMEEAGVVIVQSDDERIKFLPDPELAEIQAESTQTLEKFRNRCLGAVREMMINFCLWFCIGLGFLFWYYYRENRVDGIALMMIVSGAYVIISCLRAIKVIENETPPVLKENQSTQEPSSSPST